MGLSLDPNQIDPIDTAGAPVADGTYGLTVENGMTAGLAPALSGLTSFDASVSINDNGDGTLDLAATAGGGGAGAGRDRRWNIGTGEASIDEFNDDVLAAAWVRVDGTGAAAGNCAWTEGADSLSARRIAANTSNTFQALVRPIGTAPATGDAWVTCMTLFGQDAVNYILGGIVITDGTIHGNGKQITAEVGSATLSPFRTAVAAAWTNYTTSSSVSTARTTPPVGTPIFVRLVYKGSNQWRADISPNGVSWILGASLITLASFTPSHVGFYSRDAASGTLSVISYEFLRRVSGVS